MAVDKSLFPRLKRLFSTDVIIRNVGGKQLRVMDVERIQSFGQLQTNSLVDRFTRLHKSGQRMQFNPTLNYQTLRLQLYADYEAMDTDGIIANVLDILCEESTLKGESDEVLTIRSSNENIQRILYNLFYEVLNIEFNLPMWIRSMCLHENTIIPLLDGTEMSIKDLSDKFNSKDSGDIWVYSVQEGTNQVVPGKIKWCGLTREKTTIVRVTLDDGTYLDTTPDHKFIMRDGTKVQACDLKEGNSLMPFYTKKSSKTADGMEGYEKIYNPMSDKYNITHRLIAHECHVRNIKEEVKEGGRYDTHHIDFNKRNNAPTNLVRLKYEDHLKLHTDLCKEVLWGNPEIIEKRKSSIQKWLTSDKRKSDMSSAMKGIYPEAFKSYNDSPEHKKHNSKRAESIKKSWETGKIKIVKIGLDAECIAYISQYIQNKDRYVTITELLEYLKNDKTFESLYANANTEYTRDFKKTFYITAFSTLIERATGMKYHRFVASIVSKAVNDDNYKRQDGIYAEKALTNHKVVSVVYMNELSDTYCMEVEGPSGEQDRHNFAVCSNNVDGTYSRNGVFVSNCKYGDFFLKLDIAEKFGVYSCRPLSVYDMIREEGQDPNNPSYIRFVYDPVSVAGGTTATKNKEYFENFEIAHFRLLTDTNYLPFGRSYIEPARKYFKQYILMMDAMLLHRIMRAPEKRVFYINVGNIPPNEVNAFVQQTVNSMKKTPFMDQNTGDYNLKFNVQNMLEDFYIPVRPGDNTTKIDTTKGLEYAGIEDVEFLRDLMLGALKVPKSFLNYSDELNGKSTISALDVRFSRSIERLQRIILSELEKIALIHLYVQGFEDSELVNFELKLNNPSIIYEQEKIALMKEKVALAGDIMEKKLFSSDYIGDKIFQMSQEQILEQRELIAQDAQRAFRYNQIQTEGNDPSISGESYGTPHDLASIYKNNASGKEDVPDDYDEISDVNKQLKMGRPKEKASIYKTDKSAFGRDPLGSSGMKKDGDDGKLTYKNKPSAYALESMKRVKDSKKKKLMIFEQKNEEPDLLNEEKVIGDNI
jgi:hypothetical protein